MLSLIANLRIALYQSVSCDWKSGRFLSDGLIFRSVDFSTPPLQHPLAQPLMRGKRAQTASSSPHYERVIWVEKKTARGPKITANISASPQTPKIRKQATPLNKIRRLEASPTTQSGTSGGMDYIPEPPTIAFKKKGGKVCFVDFC